MVSKDPILLTAKSRQQFVIASQRVRAGNEIAQDYSAASGAICKEHSAWESLRSYQQQIGLVRKTILPSKNYSKNNFAKLWKENTSIDLRKRFVFSQSFIAGCFLFIPPDL